MEIECLTVVISDNSENDIFHHFYSSSDVGRYIATLPLFYYKRIQIFPDKQAKELVTQYDESIEPPVYKPS